MRRPPSTYSTPTIRALLPTPGSYKNMIKTNYCQALVAASAGKGREVKPAQYGYQFKLGGVLRTAISLGTNPATNTRTTMPFTSGMLEPLHALLVTIAGTVLRSC